MEGSAEHHGEGELEEVGTTEGGGTFGGTVKTVTAGDTTQDRERGIHSRFSLSPSTQQSLSMAPMGQSTENHVTQGAREMYPLGMPDL